MGATAAGGRTRLGILLGRLVGHGGILWLVDLEPAGVSDWRPDVAV
jgi:hypothetical protein